MSTIYGPKAEALLRHLVRQKWTIEEICQVFPGRTHNAIEKKLAAMGLKVYSPVIIDWLALARLKKLKRG